MGQYEEAIAANKKAINLWPNYVGAHIGLAASYNREDHMEDARGEALF